MLQDRLLSIAGGVSFFVLLAIFPAITALVSAYGLFQSRQDCQLIGQLRNLVPANVLTIVHEAGQTHRLQQQSDIILGTGHRHFRPRFGAR